MRIERSVEIAAPPEKVWAIVSDVQRWGEWTPSIDRIESLDGSDHLRMGSRYKIHQPKLPAAVWKVTVIEAGQYFEWQSLGPGIKMSAGHRVGPAPGGGSRATLILRQEGPLGALIGRLLEKVSRPYVEMEAQGLKRRSEAS